MKKAVPSHKEWLDLKDYLIANGFNYDGTTEGNKIAKSLASSTWWIASTWVGSVGNFDYPEYRNKSGFFALPGGYLWTDYDFHDVGSYSYWWALEDDQFEYSRWDISRHDRDISSAAVMVKHIVFLFVV